MLTSHHPHPHRHPSSFSSSPAERNRCNFKTNCQYKIQSERERNRDSGKRVVSSLQYFIEYYNYIRHLLTLIYQRYQYNCKWRNALWQDRYWLALINLMVFNILSLLNPKSKHEKSKTTEQQMMVQNDKLKHCSYLLLGSWRTFPCLLIFSISCHCHRCYLSLTIIPKETSINLDNFPRQVR